MICTLNEENKEECVPPLAIALWAIRERMEDDTEQTLNFVNNLKFNAVELAGFFNLRIDYLEWHLRKRNISVCGVHGPSIDLVRENIEFINWAKEFTKLFNTNCLGIELSPGIINEIPISYNDCNYDKVVKSIQEIAKSLPSNIKVSYHCFPEDFFIVEGKPLVSRLFEKDFIPNLGLQIDTFWLSRSAININYIIDLPIHSVHLNVRNDNGDCCSLDENPERCYDYVKAIAKKYLNNVNEITWILECDSDNNTQYSDNNQLVKIKEISNNWTSFWTKLKNDIKNELTEKTTIDIVEEIQQTQTTIKIPYEKTKDLGKLYQAEIKQAMTGYCFWDEKRSDLQILPIDDEKLNALYVIKRKTKIDLTGEYLKVYENEEEVFSEFWNKEGAQLLLLEGGTGAGKSTLLRYIFQYYLFHRETLLARLSDPKAIGAMEKEHMDSANRHLIFYVDLRRSDHEGNISIEYQIFTKLKKSISETIKNRKIIEFDEDYNTSTKNDKEWVLNCIKRLALQSENEERRWYISLFIDNSDQLDEIKQKQILSLIKDEFIPEERLHVFAESCLNNDDIGSRMFWRIILPIRKETYENLSKLIEPIKNCHKCILKPLDFDDLSKKRGDFLHQVVLKSRRYLNVNVTHDPERDRFNLRLPSEVAKNILDAWFAASRISENNKEPISEYARNILDLLCGDSARRRLSILSRAALSHSFIERHKRAIIEKWEPLVSDFYFFDGLICGESNHFEPSNQHFPVLNLYNLGAKAGDPYSIFIGLHSLLLLKKGLNWIEVKQILRNLGYSTYDIDSCEMKLINAEIIKALWNGKFISEQDIILGLWALLKEQAYTDNMAIHCALEWKQPQLAIITNPLDYEKLPTRFEGSLNFMNLIWESEKVIYTHRNDALSQPGLLIDFQNAIYKLRDNDFKSVTAYVVKKYSEISQITSHSKLIKKTIEKNNSNKVKWDNCVARCNNLLVECDNLPEIIEADV